MEPVPSERVYRDGDDWVVGSDTGIVGVIEIGRGPTLAEAYRAAAEYLSRPRRHFAPPTDTLREAGELLGIEIVGE